MNLRRLFQLYDFPRLLPAAFALFVVLPHLAERGWGQRTTASVAGSVTDASGVYRAAVRSVVGPQPRHRARARRSLQRSRLLRRNLGLPRASIGDGKEDRVSSPDQSTEFVLPWIRMRRSISRLTSAPLRKRSVLAAETVAIDTRHRHAEYRDQPEADHDLPLNGRNVLQLMQLTPGTLQRQRHFQPERHAAGSRERSSSRPVAGAATPPPLCWMAAFTKIPYTEVANVAPNPDAIQEFSFQTNNYSAKFGGRGGGVVNMVTKSGTQRLCMARFSNTSATRR